MAKEHAQLALAPGMEQDEIREIRHLVWQGSLKKHLILRGKTSEALTIVPKKQRWKIEIAQQIRAETGASIRWLSENLHLGQATSTRSYFSRHHVSKNQQTTAWPKASDWISKHCKGKINKEFPSELRDKTFGEIEELAKSGNRVAKKAWKLSTDGRFQK